MKFLQWLIIILLKVNISNELENYIFTTKDLPSEEFLPILSNGHLAFQVWGNSIFMNGLYNGYHGLSHRARIPNYANIVLEPNNLISKSHTLNVRDGIYQTVFDVDGAQIKQTIYAHRYFNRAIVNEIEIIGNSSIGYEAGENVLITLERKPGRKSLDLMKARRISSNCFKTKIKEDRTYHNKFQLVCIAYNRVGKEIELPKGKSAKFLFVVTVDPNEKVARTELSKVLSSKNLLSKHTDEWRRQWASFSIHVEGNDNLAKAVTSSLFYLTSALPSLSSRTRNNEFFGLSPTGLGRGGKDLNNYEGHSFWDTEIWMFPPILLMNHEWAKQLLNYRIRKMPAAQDNANATGYRGTRFPWESAFTGREVTQPCCPRIADGQVHVSADISFALRQFLSATHNQKWMLNHGCQLAEGIAEFWASRATFNETSNDYEIKNVMGPDEDHDRISNNIYTNVAAALSLRFGDLSKCLRQTHPVSTSKWSTIADKLRLLYDSDLDYHPQYEGYEQGTQIKQADTVLIGYPLMLKMNRTTHRNDLETYEKVTRHSGPAMTWAMHAINWLKLDEISKAEPHFQRSFEPYQRPPFKVWSEVIAGESGASNFITGAGGFLQALLFGYFGITLHLDYMQIKNPQLPLNATRIVVNGVKYLDAKFRIEVSETSANLTATELADNYLSIDINGESQTAVKDVKYLISGKTVILRSVESIFGDCPIQLY